jgi:Right handed beta helix region
VSATPSVGILVARLGGQGSLGSLGGVIAGNSVLGPQDGVLLVGNTGAEVLDNRIESDVGEMRFAIGLLSSSRVRVHGNRITNAAFPLSANGGTANEIADNTMLRGGGATLLNQTSGEFSQNRVEDMRNYGLIALQGLAKFAIIENRFLSCGYAQAPSIGIGVSQHFGELHVESNEVMNTGVSPDNATISKLAWGIFADLVLESRVQSNNVTYANAALLDVNQEHRALWLRGSLEQTIDLAAGQLVLGFSVQILDNKFLGPGRSALIEIAQQVVSVNFVRRFERVFFNNNFCWHVSVSAQPAATVSLVGRSAIVMGNHIKTNTLIPSVDFHGMKDAVYMGNIAQTNPANFGGIPTPVSGFNKP